MVKRDEIIKTIEKVIGNDLLSRANKVDTNANGVQILGKESVFKVAIGVSSSLDFFNSAVKSKADFCITHHGIHLDSRYIYNSRFDLSQQAILRKVFESNLTVIGYHFALDAHPEIGNSAVLIKELGANRLETPYLEGGWGWIGEYKDLQPVESIAKKLSAITNQNVFTVYAGPQKIKRIGVCTGGAKPYGAMLHEINNLGVQLHITGEITHSGIHIAKECGFNYFAAGHYATEVFGVRELGKKLKEIYKEKLEVEFIDIPNPL